MRTAIRYRGCAFLGVLAICATMTQPAWSQRKGQQSPRVQLSGKITKVARGRIHVSAESVRITGGETKQKTPPKKPGGTPYVIAVLPRTTTVRVSGTATPKFLRPGQYVRFSGKVNEKSQIQGEIGLLEVFIPEAKFQPKFDVRTPAPKFASDAPPKKTRDFEAQGVVRGYRRGQLAVLVAAGKQVTAPVSEEAQVRFTLTNYSQVKPGDSINVNGRLFRPGQVIGEQVNIAMVRKEAKNKSKTKSPKTKSESGKAPEKKEKPKKEKP